MSAEDYLEIPTGLLGSWNYDQKIAIGIAELQCALLVEYAPSSMYELLKLKNPYKDDSAKFNLFVYSLRVVAKTFGAGFKDTLWLGPFVGSLIEEDGRQKLNIITELPYTDVTEKNGWSIIPSIPVNSRGFDEDGKMSIYGGLILSYHDIYNSRFIIPYYDDEKKELSLKIRILCKGKDGCPDAIKDQQYDKTDGRYYAVFEGIGKKGCLNYNSNISDCLPGCKYATDGDSTVETAPDVIWRLVAIVSTFLLSIIILIFLIKLIIKLIRR